MKFTIVRSDEGDWEGLYVDGVLVTEGHEVTATDVIDYLVMNTEHEKGRAVVWESSVTDCVLPKYLKDLPRRI